MKTKILSAALLASAVLGVGALAPSAASAVTAGNYMAGGIQPICLVADGTWYGEVFPGWHGTWGTGPTKDDAFVLHGNYAAGGGAFGTGNDAMVIQGQTVDWTEWRDDESFQNFIDSSFTRIKGKCTPPAARANPHPNPMD